MKIIFLDIDGVLNNQKWVLLERTFKNFDPENVKCLNRIIKQTGAKVVISSQWRLYPYNFEMLFHRQGIDCEIVGHTPIMSKEINGILHTVIRGEEIKQWLAEAEEHDHGGIENFVIIDDDADMGELIHRLVRTDHMDGLTNIDANCAIAMLNQNIS